MFLYFTCIISFLLILCKTKTGMALKLEMEVGNCNSFILPDHHRASDGGWRSQVPSRMFLLHIMWWLHWGWRVICSCGTFQALLVSIPSFYSYCMKYLDLNVTFNAGVPIIFCVSVQPMQVSKHEIKKISFCLCFNIYGMSVMYACNLISKYVCVHIRACAHTHTHTHRHAHGLFKNFGT
jgi:hypothetical protein